MEINGTDLSMIRGDSETIDIKISTPDGEVRPLVQGDMLYFSVKKNPKFTKYAFQKIVTKFREDGTAQVVILPDDTKDLQFDDYRYDVQLTTKEGEVKTIIEDSLFRIKVEITDD